MNLESSTPILGSFSFNCPNYLFQGLIGQAFLTCMQHLPVATATIPTVHASKKHAVIDCIFSWFTLESVVILFRQQAGMQQRNEPKILALLSYLPRASRCFCFVDCSNFLFQSMNKFNKRGGYNYMARI